MTPTPEGHMASYIRRRKFLAALGSGAAAAWPLAPRAQQLAKKILRVGTVSGSQKSSPQWAAFVRRMAELGYEEGKTFTFDLVPAANKDEYETGYQMLAARELDILLATGPEIALKSALAATRMLPIVMIAIDFDPFARGYAPRTGGAYDSHHRTTGIAGRTRRRGCMAARGA